MAMIRTRRRADAEDESRFHPVRGGRSSPRLGGIPQGRMQTWTLSPALAIALVAAGCSAGGGQPDDAGSSGLQSSSEAPESPSPSPEGASIEQWASVVAEQKDSYEDTQQSWDDLTCSSLAASNGAVDCQAYMYTMGLVAETAAISIGGTVNPDTPKYLGEPPAEIVTLVDETIAAAQHAADVSVGPECFDDDCIGESVDAERAWNQLGDKYAAWDPYL